MGHQRMKISEHIYQPEKRLLLISSWLLLFCPSKESGFGNQKKVQFFEDFLLSFSLMYFFLFWVMYQN